MAPSLKYQYNYDLKNKNIPFWQLAFQNARLDLPANKFPVKFRSPIIQRIVQVNEYLNKSNPKHLGARIIAIGLFFARFVLCLLI